MDPVREQRLFVWHYVVLLLSIYALAALIADTVFRLPSEISRLLGYIDVAVCAAFAADFVLQLRAAPRKWRYFLTWGWVDLISSIPILPFARLGRAVRIFRILRVMRGIRSARVIMTHLFDHRVGGVFATVALSTFVLMVFSAVAILNLENTPNATIKTAEDALWWAIATITTVGYGDVYPVTTMGRAVGGLLMVGGVALFCTFTATVASLFVHRGQKGEEDRTEQILRRLTDVSDRLARLEKPRDEDLEIRR
jgi:voltage-gated potassium channel